MAVLLKANNKKYIMIFMPQKKEILGLIGGKGDYVYVI